MKEGRTLELVKDGVEQSPAVRRAVRDALHLLRTKRVRMLVLIVVEEGDDDGRHQIFARTDDTHGLFVIGAIEEMKLSYCNQREESVCDDDDT